MYMHFRSEDRNSNYITIIPKRFSGDRTVCLVICINGVPFEVKEIEIPIRMPSECYNVLCSCYGRIYCMTDDDCRFFYLWNPSKSIFRTIPYPSGDRNTMTTSITHGIGPDLCIYDILIIRIIYFCHGIDEGTLPGKILPHAEVYSQNTNSWSRIETRILGAELTF